jgi:AraC family transcriptional regulator
MADEPAKARWSGTPDWYLWEGGFLAIGRSDGLVAPHEHHAIQIVLAVEGSAGIRGIEGDWRFGAGLVVLPHVVHAYDANGCLGVMVFVDPESAEGAWLRGSVRESITVLDRARVDACTADVRAFLEQPSQALGVAALARRIVQALCTGAPPSRRMDPRVTRVLAAMRGTDEELSLGKAAALAFLSPSRFAHLFKQQIGLPFRRYLLWRRLTRAMLAVGQEGSITAAAHAAGFADAAHLTRTYYQMFGLPPSAMMRGRFFEIAPPWELAGSPAAR